jgi:hypothetical protein
MQRAFPQPLRLNRFRNAEKRKYRLPRITTKGPGIWVSPTGRTIRGASRITRVLPEFVAPGIRRVREAKTDGLLAPIVKKKSTCSKNIGFVSRRHAQRFVSVLLHCFLGEMLEGSEALRWDAAGPYPSIGRRDWHHKQREHIRLAQFA